MPPSATATVNTPASRFVWVKSAKAIVSRVMGGETAAFAILVDRHSRRIHRVCASVTRDRDKAEDCVQKSFLLALERLGQFRAEAQFSTWLTRIAVNVALTHLRARASRLSAEVPVEAGQEGRGPLAMADMAPIRKRLCFKKSWENCWRAR